MSKNLIAAAAFASVAFTSNVFAEDGKINFTGTIINNPCEVTADTKNQTVDMGKIGKTSFPGAGSVSGAKQFTLELTKCPDTSKLATVRFDGVQVPGDDSTLALSNPEGDDTAKGVGIQIMDSQNKVVKLYQESSAYPISSTGTNVLKFVARYYATEKTVTAGVANAVSNFTIIYQ